MIGFLNDCTWKTNWAPLLSVAGCRGLDAELAYLGKVGSGLVNFLLRSGRSCDVRWFAA